MRSHWSWQGLPYYPISLFYKRRFGEKVYKIPVSVAQTCPNREGIRGMKTCNFCDVWGSAAYPELRQMELGAQIEKTRSRMKELYNAKKFLVYFQAYTNTFSKSAQLKAQFETAFKYSDVLGAVVGTRPDCLSDMVLDMWNEYIDRGYFISVELGVQTFNEDQLIWMRRGHTAEQSIKAIEKIKERCPGIDLGIHLMFGLPNETELQIKESALRVNNLPIDNVKLHNLHVLKNTPLEDDFKKGEFSPIDWKDYSRRVNLFLQYLSPTVAVHRLSALATRKDELVAPSWVGQKMKTYQSLLNGLKERGAYQGQFYQPFPGLGEWNAGSSLIRTSLARTSDSGGNVTRSPRIS